MLQANFPAKIVYGENSLEFLSTLKAKRVVICADEIFHKFNPDVFAAIDSIFDTMGAQHWLYFGEGTEPTLGFIKENSKKLTEHQPDLILAIGGGSVIDAVKVMEVYYEHPDITNEQKARDFINKKDKQRQSYYNYYSSKKWGRADSYDFTICSATFGIEGSVKLIAQLVDDFESRHAGHSVVEEVPEEAGKKD